MSERTAIQVADGVRMVTVGAPVGSHVYLIDDPDGLIAFDAGVRGTGPQILAAAGEPIARVLLSHSHPDHRGAAPELQAPVYCHPDEVADAEGDGGLSYADFSQIANPTVRDIFPQLIAMWDSGPVEIAGTVQEADRIAGFRVVHVPGHAPGLIALYRETDGLLLAADAVYTIELETGTPGPARVPHPAVNWDTTMAGDSILRLAGLEPASAWAGHADHIEQDTAEQLRRAAGSSRVPAAVPAVVATQQA
jgi:glyoxylase-like metal-dependent hydrolase (beta-lactamase superfamily II)